MDLKHILMMASTVCFAMGGVFLATGFVLLFKRHAERQRVSIKVHPRATEIRSFKLAA